MVNVSGSTYTLMLKKMTETTQFGGNTTYSYSTLAAKCATFQSNMSAAALSVTNNKTVQGVTAKVWIATLNDIKNWTDTSDPTSNAWSGVRKWDKGDGVYDGVGTYGYWCSDRYASTSDVYLILYTGNFANSSPTGTQGFRPCIEVTQ